MRHKIQEFKQEERAVMEAEKEALRKDIEIELDEATRRKLISLYNSLTIALGQTKEVINDV